MHEATALFDLVDRLEQSHPFDADRVGRVTGLRVVRDAAQPNGSFSEWHGVGRPPSPIDKLELRLAGPGATARALLILEVRKGPCIGLQTIVSRFGADLEIDVPTAHPPRRDLPVYYVFRRAWGSLSFGLVGGAEGCLHTIVLNEGKD